MIESVIAFVIALAASIFIAIREHGKRKEVESELEQRTTDLQGWVAYEKRMNAIHEENALKMQEAEQGIKDGKRDYFERGTL